MLVGAAAVGSDAADWMAEITLAIRAEIPVKTLADVIHDFPTHGEVLEAPLRALALTGTSCRDNRDEHRRGQALSEIGMETPGEDAAEQAREVPEEETGELRELPFEVDEADAAEQVRDVGYDDEDYR
jgi:hypothetical protein